MELRRMTNGKKTSYLITNKFNNIRAFEHQCTHHQNIKIIPENTKYDKQQKKYMAHVNTPQPIYCSKQATHVYQCQSILSVQKEWPNCYIELGHFYIFYTKYYIYID